MKKVGAVALVFALLMMIAACGAEANRNDNDNENESISEAYRFNEPVLALLTGDEPLVVRYFAAWSGREVQDIYSAEYIRLEDAPEAREAMMHPRTGVSGSGPWLIEGLDELEERTAWMAAHYDDAFFESYYLLAIQIYTPVLSIQDIVHQICEYGIVAFRPLMLREEVGDTMVGQWLVLAQIPRDFRVQTFQVEFEGNPWAV